MQQSSSTTGRLICRDKVSSGLKPKDSMIFVIFSLERIANTCLPVLPSSGQESKDKPKAFRKSFGSSLAKS